MGATKIGPIPQSHQSSCPKPTLALGTWMYRHPATPPQAVQQVPGLVNASDSSPAVAPVCFSLSSCYLVMPTLLAAYWKVGFRECSWLEHQLSLTSKPWLSWSGWSCLPDSPAHSLFQWASASVSMLDPKLTVAQACRDSGECGWLPVPTKSVYLLSDTMSQMGWVTQSHHGSWLHANLQGSFIQLSRTLIMTLDPRHPTAQSLL